MKALMAMFDSLNRRMPPPYGCDWTHAPNFARMRSPRRTIGPTWRGFISLRRNWTRPRIPVTREDREKSLDPLL
jgi:hypothetical protein